MLEIKYVIAKVLNQVQHELVGVFDTEENKIHFGQYDYVLGGRYWQVGVPRSDTMHPGARCTCGQILWRFGENFSKGYTTIYCPNCGKEHTLVGSEK